MTETITVTINGRPISVPAGTIVVVALALAGELRFRRSIAGHLRGPFCGMGVCFECCVTIDGRPHCRSCQTLCAEGMEVRTDD